MCEVIERFLDVKVVSFISDEMFSFGAICNALVRSCTQVHIDNMNTILT